MAIPKRIPLYKKAKNDNPEDIIQAKLFKFIKTKYPHVKQIWNASGEFAVKSNSDYGKINKLKARGIINRSMPDGFIPFPTNSFHGMFIELKAENKNPIKKDGFCIKDETVISQNEAMLDLQEQGYFCTFAVGFEQAKHFVESYLDSSAFTAMPLLGHRTPKEEINFSDEGLF
jgi:hypothetical protein